MRTINQARRQLGLSQMELSGITGIHQRLISEIESFKRAPTVTQRMALTRALGPNVEFLERGGSDTMSVPIAPEPKWDKTGKPDFTCLEGQENQSIMEQLEVLIADDYNHLLDKDDFTKIKALYPTSVLFEVQTNGQSEIFRRSYLVQDGQASLLEDGERVPEKQFKILTRRKIARAGVPEMPTGHYEGQGVHRRFVLNEDD